ncbi:Uncharacterised protein [Mycobacteroides abscessus subsp. abscessus]|uniref:Transmembrane protein n=1 Tax=Mycobacteroides abscessus TaxID=36809 RepID=A0AB33TG21_9MYCO|nr:Uncharacterised protein [Mycobacteroides abscessus]SHV69334.1 Uncharacterised protein [Mycobacteroides abscessus subsp. abscessus]SKI85908.1 Uncharacterised protein [Mycobacteroides abscessus subsp. massiliense]CPT77343.1 Uncharacterised protein [Mycobacteroides abscessus]CPV17688.1 Uncharacterised protein [Mycobacteroides abscessus]
MIREVVVPLVWMLLFGAFIGAVLMASVMAAR